MITHETKLMSKDMDEQNNEYEYNVKKRDQLKEKAKTLVGYNDELNKELENLIETDN